MTIEFKVMEIDAEQIMARVHALVDEYRPRCLWYLREDYYPETPAEACRVLEAIQRHGDAEAFQKAAPIRQWLLQNFSEPSAP